MDSERRTPLLGLATEHGGVLDREQLLAAGLSVAAIDSRVRRGAIEVLHDGVYLCPHLSLSAVARWYAAVLATPGSALSHVSAGAYWGMCRDRSIGVEVSTTAHRRASAGVVVHQVRRLEAVQRGALRVTPPHRVLLDMAPHWSADRLLRAAHEAERRRTLDVPELLAANLRGRRGVGRLREVQDHYREGTRSELERLLVRLARDAGLPEPTGQHQVAGWQVDVAWPEQRFGVELQSWAHHRDRAAFERDARKQLVLAAAGWDVLPVTWREVTARPQEVLRALRSRI